MERRGGGGGGGGCLAAPPFTVREVSRDRGNFLLSRMILASRVENCRGKRPLSMSERAAVPRRSASGITHRNKKIDVYFPHARRIVSSINDAPMRHGQFLPVTI